MSFNCFSGKNKHKTGPHISFGWSTKPISSIRNRRQNLKTVSCVTEKLRISFAPRTQHKEIPDVHIMLVIFCCCVQTSVEPIHAHTFVFSYGIQCCHRPLSSKPYAYITRMKSSLLWLGTFLLYGNKILLDHPSVYTRISPYSLILLNLCLYLYSHRVSAMCRIEPM